MATAQNYQANLPNVAVPEAGSYMDFSSNSTGKSVFDKVGRWLGISDNEQKYQNLLTENNRAYEQALLREQRDYEEYVRNREYEREDTKYQRLRKDLAAAGINPLYALQGGLSGSSAQGQPAGNSTNVSGGSSAKSKEDEQSKGLAALIAGVAKIIAAII